MRHRTTATSLQYRNYHLFMSAPVRLHLIVFASHVHTFATIFNKLFRASGCASIARNSCWR